jgi:tryptophan halogenase
MTNETIRSIAIIGGGTAGWLAANHVAVEFSDNPNVSVTLIESEDIPIIGVGEGTVPYIRHSLQKFGISEAELLLKCETTFKTGIKFQGWLDPNIHGEGNHYYHPFESPFPNQADLTPFWLNSGKERAFHSLSLTAELSDSNFCPKLVSSVPYEGAISYAYHVNAHKFAELLGHNARTRLGVKRLAKTITGASRSENGDIQALICQDGERLSFDFYVDCSGFNGILLGKTLRVPFVDKSNQVLTDTALVQQVPLRSGEEIPPYTTATAHAAGWIWDIPVTERRGTGFVYSSSHMSDDAALATYAKYLGAKEETLSPRKIPMRIGYRKEPWCQNCVALGLAQGFVEPLEATSILMTDVAANLLAKNIPMEKSAMQSHREFFNDSITFTWERCIDFIQLHYHASDRADSQFWLDNRYETHLSGTIKDRLAKWRRTPPRAADFQNRLEFFTVENYLYVLYGLNFKTNPPDISDEHKQNCETEFQKLRKIGAQARSSLLNHRLWLKELKQAAQLSNM